MISYLSGEDWELKVVAYRLASRQRVSNLGLSDAFHMVLFPDVGPPTPQVFPRPDHPSGFATTHLGSEEGVATGVAWLFDHVHDVHTPRMMSNDGSS